MTSVDAADHLAIANVLARYCRTCDDGSFDDLVDLFTEDGTFEYGGTVTAGREALRSYFATVQTPERRGKHLTTNAVVCVEGDRAEVTSDWVFLTFVEGVLTPKLTGRYQDVLHRGRTSWRIARRVVVPLTPPV
jgi:3-phenylpropionate/cinnamic acid dioxygenase small subunit